MATAGSKRTGREGGLRRASRAPLRPRLLALAAAALIAAGAADAQVHGARTVVFTPSYGVEADCLDAGGECGKLVADDVCEENRAGPALNFGRADHDLGRYAVACDEPGAATVQKAAR